MAKLQTLIVLSLGLLTSIAAHAQQLPAGNLVVQIDCSLADGVTFQEAVVYGRNQARDENQPGQVFYRRPIFVDPGFGENYDFRVALYYTSFAEYVSRTSTPPSRDVQHAADRRPDYFTCNLASQRISQVRGIPESDGFSGDVSLMTTRLCMLNDGQTVADAYQFVLGVAANYRAAGETSLMQMYVRSLGPVENGVAGGAVLIASVGATAESMAARLDLVREGLNVLAGLTPPMSCNYPALWETNAVYRQAPPQ